MEIGTVVCRQLSYENVMKFFFLFDIIINWQQSSSFEFCLKKKTSAMTHSPLTNPLPPPQKKKIENRRFDHTSTVITIVISIATLTAAPTAASTATSTATSTKTHIKTAYIQQPTANPENVFLEIYYIFSMFNIFFSIKADKSKQI